MTHYIYRWEKGQNHLTDRYRLHYCRALHIASRDFGPSPALSLAALPALLATTSPVDSKPTRTAGLTVTPWTR